MTLQRHDRHKQRRRTCIYLYRDESKYQSTKSGNNNNKSRTYFVGFQIFFSDSFMLVGISQSYFTFAFHHFANDFYQNQTKQIYFDSRHKRNGVYVSIRVARSELYSLNSGFVSLSMFTADFLTGIYFWVMFTGQP